MDGDEKLTLDEINELLKLNGYQQQKMREHRAETYAEHDKMTWKDLAKIKKDVEYYNKRSDFLKEQKESLIELRNKKISQNKGLNKKQGLGDIIKQINKETEQNKDRNRDRGFER